MTEILENTISGTVHTLSVSGNPNQSNSAELIINLLPTGKTDTTAFRLGAGAAPQYFSSVAAMAMTAKTHGIVVTIGALKLPGHTPEISYFGIL